MTPALELHATPYATIIYYLRRFQDTLRERYNGEELPLLPRGVTRRYAALRRYCCAIPRATALRYAMPLPRYAMLITIFTLPFSCHD